jgi:Tfp pilus assembly protein PilV
MHRKLKIAKRFAGLTLIEVVIASVLLIAAIIPILKCLTVAHASAVKIEHKSRSLLLAQAKLDQIRARSIYNYGVSFVEDNNSLDDSYLCNVSDTGSSNDLRTIVVSVGFDSDGDTDLSPDEVDVTLASLIARRWTD